MNSTLYKAFMYCMIILALAVHAWAGITVTATQEWVATFDGVESQEETAKAVAVDSDGNVYVAGQAAANSAGFLTVKYAKNGAEQWTAAYDGFYARVIAVDGDGNVYVAGAGPNTMSGRDYVTIKYDAAGDEQWVQTYNGGITFNTVVAIGLYVDGDDGKVYVYVTGDSGPSSSPDIATVKYDAADGTEIWVERYGGPDGESASATAMAVDSSGNVHVSGRCIGSVETSYDYDYATIKYDKDGVQQWARLHAGPVGNRDYAIAMGLDSLGNVAVSGYTFNTQNGNVDFLTIQYNSAGVLQWEQVYEGPTDSDSEYLYDLAVDSDRQCDRYGHEFG